MGLLFGLGRTEEAKQELQAYVDSARESDDEQEQKHLAVALYSSVLHDPKKARKNFERAEEVQASLPQHLRSEVVEERQVAQMVLSIGSPGGTVGRFQVGEAVETVGLSKVELNGRQGVVKAVREDGRREVMMDDGKTFALKPSNLMDPAKAG